MLVLLTGATTALSTVGREGRSGPQLLMLAGGLGVYLGGRLLSNVPRAVTLSALLIALSIGATVLQAPGALSGGAVAPPLYYGNANGALCTLGAGACLLAGLSQRGLWQRLVGVSGAAVFTALAAATASQAATTVGVGLILLGLALCVRPTCGRAVPVLGALAVLAVLTATVSLAAVANDRADRGQAASLLSERRIVLWSEALTLLEENPVRGVGAGQFRKAAPTAVADADASWAHSLWLQQGAETGLPGLALLLSIFGVVLLRVRASGWEDGGVPALGAALVAGLLVHASVDYILDFPLVTLVGAFLAGLAAAHAGASQ